MTKEQYLTLGDSFREINKLIDKIDSFELKTEIRYEILKLDALIRDTVDFDK